MLTGRWKRRAAAALILGGLLVLAARPLLTGIGRLLTLTEAPFPAEAAVVLNSGTEVFPRLLAAADLFRAGRVERVVVNGDRKTDTLRRLERRGFRWCCPWYEAPVRVLEIGGVPRDRIWAVAAEDAYDTVSEARAVGERLAAAGLTRVIVVTSRFHSRRARWVWRRLFRERLAIAGYAAPDDPYRPDAWWRHGRQVRWVMAEYGGWLYDLWRVGDDAAGDGGKDGGDCGWRTEAGALRVWDCGEGRSEGRAQTTEDSGQRGSGSEFGDQRSAVGGRKSERGLV